MKWSYNKGDLKVMGPLCTNSNTATGGESKVLGFQVLCRLKIDSKNGPKTEDSYHLKFFFQYSIRRDQILHFKCNSPKLFAQYAWYIPLSILTVLQHLVYQTHLA